MSGRRWTASGLTLRSRKAADTPRVIAGYSSTTSGAQMIIILRKLKRIALRAKLNRGQCKTTVTKGRYHKKRAVKVTCKTDPVCQPHGSVTRSSKPR
jgi:hypothetical protein